MPCAPRGGVLTPDEVDQRVGGDVAAEPHGERCEHRSRLARADVDDRIRIVTERHLARPEHPHPHGPNRIGSQAAVAPSHAPAGPRRHRHGGLITRKEEPCRTTPRAQPPS